jgi:glycosyltransferase involved in cell wall biosynthesis
MWTYNGEGTLRKVLKQINKVIPSCNVNNRFIVDDGSSDNTVKIALSCGWMVFRNEGKGISDGANTALKYVTSEYFASFEQDLLLSPQWFNKMRSMIKENKKIGACSGVRFADKPLAVHELQKYVMYKYRGQSVLSPYLKSRRWSAFTLGKSLDNTLYLAKAVRSVGGFPCTGTNVGVDTALAYAFERDGYQWHVDCDVQSVHLRKDLKHELEHQEWYGSQLPYVWRYVHSLGYQSFMNRWSVLWRLFNSPLTGLFVAFKTKTPSTVLVHPLMRLYFTKGLLKAGGKL